jgi:hypothetical protein
MGSGLTLDLNTELHNITVAMADQIRTTLAAVADLDIQVEPRWILAPTPLAIDVIPGDIGRDPETAAFGDISGGYFLTVRARINTPDFDSSYDVLIALMDDGNDLSLAGAVMDDETLNGTASSVDLRDFTGLRAYERLGGDGADLGFQFTALVVPGRS